MDAVLATSAGWALAVAVCAAILGWVPGRVLGCALRGRGYTVVAALMLAPVCVPAYVLFYAWWQAWPPDSALYRWAVETDNLALVKGATVLIGMTCWSWPLVAWCVAGFSAQATRQRDELALVDGAGGLRRLALRLRDDGRGLALGALVVYLFVFNSTTSFDIAQIYTVGFELRALEAQGAGAAMITLAAAPAIALALVGVIAAWRLTGGMQPAGEGRPGRLGRPALIATGVIGAITVALPIVWLMVGLEGLTGLGEFLRLHGGNMVNTLAVAALAGGVAMLVTVGLAITWHAGQPWMRRAAGVQTVGWLIAALVPGTVVTTALAAAYNVPRLDRLIYLTPVILVLGLLARFAFIGGLLARWVSEREPKSLAALRQLDGAVTLTAYLHACWPRLLAAGGATGAIVAVLSLSDLAVVGRLQPAGFALIATDILDAIHYQRPRVVMLASVLMLALGVGAGFAVMALWWPLRRWGSALALGAAVTVAAAGCAPTDASTQSEPVRIFGSIGPSLGQFTYPRAMSLDLANRRIYVVDKTARVQRYGLDGVPQLQWKMPESKHGKPVGLAVAPDGTIWVADTHYYRVIQYDADGNELLRFGSYGTGPGQFIYPTDIAFGPDDQIYVGEYGGNDRIQVFDDQGTYLFEFGSFGSEPGQFNRPQGLDFDAASGALYVADAVNHRISVHEPDGTLRRIVGTAGRSPGQLAYPYDVQVLPGGSLLVSEFGNNRVQILSPDGAALWTFGSVGTRPGEVRYPWGAVATEHEIFVLDSGNNRVQVVRMPELE